MKFTGTKDYVATDDLKIAVNAAMVLERPLLVKGEVSEVAPKPWTVLKAVPLVLTANTVPLPDGPPPKDVP